ncbi:MAG: hypothetical protein LC795_10715 [Acidobacteria bacterium]|nr:hypothetical protein [Acidobacteriota bacterium]MCA1619761.1 hypothetical protein [Acidobacteriota bacterium]
MRTNYVLIDYESVQPKDLSALKHDYVRVIVFVGAHQNKIPFETAAALQQMGSNVEYVKVSGTGPNALDFHIAFYIGQLAGKDPEAYFHVVSKDTGFDPLLSHLKTRKLRALRVQKVGDIPFLKAGDAKSAPDRVKKVGNAKSTPDRIAVIIGDLRKRGAAKPRTVTTLTSTIGALFLKQLTPDEISALMTALQERGYVSVAGSKVSYSLPT